MMEPFDDDYVTRTEVQEMIGATMTIFGLVGFFILWGLHNAYPQ